MLRRVGEQIQEDGAAVAISQASFPSPFVSGLEYGAPARGSWNIAHTGFLIPESHEIFVCAESCLRGVVLTAAEMGASHRFSMIAIRENNVLDGDMEDLIIDGVEDILGKLPKRPKAVLLYTSCIHHFIGCDLPLVYRTLRRKFPDVDFTDCYMNPIMRKSGLTPEQLMRRQLYSLLKEQEKEPKAINIIGNDLATDRDSELVKLIEENGWKLREITGCTTYDQYQEMAKASYNITYQPAAKAGGEALKKRLGQKHLYLPMSFDYQEIEGLYGELCRELGIKKPDFSEDIKRCERALCKLKELLGETPVSIDYTVTFRPLGLALLLLEHGIRVERVYIDSITGEEKPAFEKLQEIAPDLKLYATVNAKMRLLPRKTEEKMVAVGQKAAYFTGSNYFVNIVECGGFYGFEGIVKLCDLIKEAFLEEKDAKSLIQIKGWGCGCCQ